MAAGSGEGGFGTFFGVVSGGELTWLTQPGLFSLGDGTQYSVAFSDVSGVTGSSATVSGTIRLVQAAGAVQVPEPGSLVLFGLGLLGIGLAARGRRRFNRR